MLGMIWQSLVAVRARLRRRAQSSVFMEKELNSTQVF